MFSVELDSACLIKHVLLCFARGSCCPFEEILEQACKQTNKKKLLLSSQPNVNYNGIEVQFSFLGLEHSKLLSCRGSLKVELGSCVWIE